MGGVILEGDSLALFTGLKKLQGYVTAYKAYKICHFVGLKIEPVL